MNTQSTFNHTCNEISEPQIVRLPLHTCKLAEMMRDDDDGDEKDDSNKDYTQTSLVAQWLRTRLPGAGDTGLSPGPGRSHMPRSN